MALSVRPMKEGDSSRTSGGFTQQTCKHSYPVPGTKYKADLGTQSRQIERLRQNERSRLHSQTDDGGRQLNFEGIHTAYCTWKLRAEHLGLISNSELNHRIHTTTIFQLMSANGRNKVSEGWRQTCYSSITSNVGPNHCIWYVFDNTVEFGDVWWTTEGDNKISSRTRQSTIVFDKMIEKKLSGGWGKATTWSFGVFTTLVKNLVLVPGASQNPYQVSDRGNLVCSRYRLL